MDSKIGHVWELKTVTGKSAGPIVSQKGSGFVIVNVLLTVYCNLTILASLTLSSLSATDLYDDFHLRRRLQYWDTASIMSCARSFWSY
jgi:hypothetical protein